MPVNGRSAAAEVAGVVVTDGTEVTIDVTVAEELDLRGSLLVSWLDTVENRLTAAVGVGHQEHHLLTVRGSDDPLGQPFAETGQDI
jgi:hypothetical protein